MGVYQKVLKKKTIMIFVLVTFICNFLLIAPAKTETQVIRVTLILGSASTYVPQLSKAYELIKEANYPLDVKLFSTGAVRDFPEIVENRLIDTDILLLEMIGQGTMDILGPMIQHKLKSSGKCYITATDFVYSQYDRINYSLKDNLRTYFQNAGTENMRRLLLRLGTLSEPPLEVSEAVTSIPSPLPAAKGFIFHPKAVNLPFNADQLILAVNGALKNKDVLEAGQVINTSYYSVYKSVNEAVYENNGGYQKDFALKLAAKSINIANNFTTQDKIEWDLNYNQFLLTEDFQYTVNQAVYQAVYELNKLALVVDAAWTAWYNRNDLNVNAEDLSSLISNILGVPKIVSLSNSISNIIKNSKNSIPDLEGVFETLSGYLAWYSAADRLKENGPWVGVVTQRPWFVAEDILMQLDLLDRIEEQGGNVVFGIPPVSSNNRHLFIRELFMLNGQSKVDVLITVLGFNFYKSPEDSVALFKELGVPVIAPTQTSSLDEWGKNPYGMDISLTTQVALPELDGRIEPIFLGGIKEIEDENGNLIERRIPLDYNTNRLAGRALAWAKLKNTQNHEKKIAVIYYNHDGGKDGIKAAYLNVIESASMLLNRLKNEGYNIIGDISSAGLKNIIDKKGRNIGSWAPGCIDTMIQEGVITISLEDYISWYNKLPIKLRNQVEEQWGPAPGNVMVHNGKILVPGKIMGNVFFGPQPMRGWGDDPDAIVHSATLPPTHQYLAFYFWLQNDFQADAVIHLGTHGTLEWLPGRIVGQGEDDWPDQLIGNMINIYPYIMNNPGEAIQAKRRSYGVTIGHLIPPMIEAGLYGELQELQDYMVNYMLLINEGLTEQAEVLKEWILEKVANLNLENEIGLSLNDDFDKAVEELHHYLEDLAEELMPYGLHTLGQPLAGELLELMLDAIVNYDNANREGKRDTIRANLLAVTYELDSIVKALAGHFIEPGPARDPIRVPDAMPTGRNLVAFRPDEIPDKVAWETGKKAADALLAAYKAEKGEYPNTVGVVLWAIETMRTRGETVAVILRLIGVEPIYPANNRVTQVKITPLEELGRPRIDVLVTISGLFRDTFANVIDLMDDAFRQVAALEGESIENNKVRKNYLDLKEKLLGNGLDEELAELLAGARIYGAAPGTYGTGVADLIETTSAWDNELDLIDAYMSRMSYIYGRNVFGQQSLDTFIENLKNVSTITQVRDSIWGTLDNDDVAQYLGGLYLAAKYYSGNDIISYIINTRGSGDPRIQTLAQFVAMELRSRVFNPKWIEGMLKEGYAGSAEIGDHIKNMFLIDAALNGIDDWAWHKVAETFVFDPNIRQQLDFYILQSIIGWALEAARRDMWNADTATLQKLADIYVQTAVNYGVVCCHHTCGNITFNEWIASYSMLDYNILTSFKEVFKAATNKDLDISLPTADEPVIPTPDTELKPTTKPESKPDEFLEIKIEVPLDTIIEEEEQKQDIQQDMPAVPHAETPKSEQEPAQQLLADASMGQRETAEKAEARANSTAGTETREPEETQAETIEEKKAEEAATEQRAYEIEVREKQRSAGQNAVTFSAIILGLAIIGLILKGYLAKGVSR